MLIDATHEEETRVAVVEGNRLTEFDYESKVRKQLKGNIFLAKVTRVEPSLQAAFVNFGGNRHGFLPFSEIHPDYYRIPIADRERLIAEQAEEISAIKQSEEEEEEKLETESDRSDGQEEEEEDEDEDILEELGGEDDEHPLEIETDNQDGENEEDDLKDKNDTAHKDSGNRNKKGRNHRSNKSNGKNRRVPHRSRMVEIVGGDDIEGDHPRRYNYRKNYKIQEVIKRGQIMLVQVSKEERGNKGAAVTTYLSLPGRYCVLMPNSPHAGGISRKIASFKDRRYMKEILNELEPAEGMSVILRTAGVSRTKAEIKRDFDYLIRLWDDIRELTLKSSAPALINEEGSLIKRSIRDIYTRDMEEVIVAGSEGYKSAKKIMKLLIPSHARRVKEYKNERLPLFQRYQMESQINEIGEPSVTMKSGGYIVINPTEALVSIDVNSGRATKERHIEETALKTNLEAADEIARQLKLRDLGGLVVIDFIDMEDRKNNSKVERRMKEALSNDRARIQIGRISSFGLLELSRQRMNPSLTESQFQRCEHCQGVGFVRALDGTAISALRSVEEIGTHGRHAEVVLRIPDEAALYILNNKRPILDSIERRYNIKVTIETDESIPSGKFTIEPGALKPEEADSGEAQDSDSSEDTKQSRNKDHDDDDDDKSGDTRKASRRRGRRGGRRRNKSEETRKNEKQNDKTVSDKNDIEKQTSEKSDPDSEKEKADKAPKKRSRKTRPDKEKDAEKKSDASETGSGKSQDNKETNDNASSHREEKEDPVPATPQRNTDYEIVSQPTETKKKGWWNKLVDS